MASTSKKQHKTWRTVNWPKFVYLDQQKRKKRMGNNNTSRNNGYNSLNLIKNK